eukprot:3027871-Amphidinium_carterae.1
MLQWVPAGCGRHPTCDVLQWLHNATSGSDRICLFVSPPFVSTPITLMCVVSVIRCSPTSARALKSGTYLSSPNSPRLVAMAVNRATQAIAGMQLNVTELHVLEGCTAAFSYADLPLKEDIAASTTH